MAISVRMSRKKLFVKQKLSLVLQRFTAFYTI